MITGLDHIVVLLDDIGRGRAVYQALLGRSPAWQNSGDGADRVLFTLDNVTLELMAPRGFDVAAERIRDVIRRSGEGWQASALQPPTLPKCIAGSSALR